MKKGTGTTSDRGCTEANIPHVVEPLPFLIRTVESRRIAICNTTLHFIFQYAILRAFISTYTFQINSLA